MCVCVCAAQAVVYTGMVKYIGQLDSETHDTATYVGLRLDDASEYLSPSSSTVRYYYLPHAGQPGGDNSAADKDHRRDFSLLFILRGGNLVLHGRTDHPFFRQFPADFSFFHRGADHPWSPQAIIPVSLCKAKKGKVCSLVHIEVSRER